LESVRLWTNGRKRRVGTITLDENGHLVFHIDDKHDRDTVEAVFRETGEVTWGWPEVGEGKLQEQKASPREPDWFLFVIANRLYPLGYQADFGASE
jgi:hypothetical protein